MLKLTVFRLTLRPHFGGNATPAARLQQLKLQSLGWRPSICGSISHVRVDSAGRLSFVKLETRRQRGNQRAETAIEAPLGVLDAL